MGINASIVKKATNPIKHNYVKGSIMKNNNPVTTQKNDEDEIQVMMRECRAKVRNSSISAASAAFIIVAKLRHIYYSTCVKGDDHFDIQTFAYMDHILFDNITPLIESVIKYGNTGISKNMLTKTMMNIIESVEYDTDVSRMCYVIEVMYAFFTM